MKSAGTVNVSTWMSGIFIQEMESKGGADKFIAKFDPDLLAEAVLEVMEKNSD